MFVLVPDMQGNMVRYIIFSALVQCIRYHREGGREIKEVISKISLRLKGKGMCLRVVKVKI